MGQPETYLNGVGDAFDEKGELTKESLQKVLQQYHRRLRGLRQNEANHPVAESGTAATWMPGTSPDDELGIPLTEPPHLSAMVSRRASNRF